MPIVRVLDAREIGADAERLRAWARAESTAREASHVSRSYCHPYAVVAWHNAPLGVDLVRIAPCDARFAQLICTPDERVDAARAADRDAHLSALWAGKEALAKALGRPLDYEPGRLTAPLAWPGGTSGPWRARPCAVPEGHVAWLVWREVTDPRRRGATVRERSEDRRAVAGRGAPGA